MHLQGVDDPWQQEAKRLLTDYYDAKSATIIEFSGGHHFPTSQVDNDAVVRAIRDIYKNLSG